MTGTKWHITIPRVNATLFRRWTQQAMPIRSTWTALAWFGQFPQITKLWPCLWQPDAKESFSQCVFPQRSSLSEEGGAKHFFSHRNKHFKQLFWRSKTAGASQKRQINYILKFQLKHWNYATYARRLHNSWHLPGFKNSSCSQVDLQHDHDIFLSASMLRMWKRVRLRPGRGHGAQCRSVHERVTSLWSWPSGLQQQQQQLQPPFFTCWFLKVPFYTRCQIFIFHPGHQWSSLTAFVIKKSPTEAPRPPPNSVY